MRVKYLLASLLMQRISPQVFEALELLDRLVESPEADTGALDSTTKLLDDALQIERTLAAHIRAAERSGTARALSRLDLDQPGMDRHPRY